MNKVWFLIKMIYRTLFRDLIIKAIDDPDSDVDDFVLARLDGLFEYTDG